MPAERSVLSDRGSQLSNANGHIYTDLHEHRHPHSYMDQHPSPEPNADPYVFKNAEANQLANCYPVTYAHAFRNTNSDTYPIGWGMSDPLAVSVGELCHRRLLQSTVMSRQAVLRIGQRGVYRRPDPHPDSNVHAFSNGNAKQHTNQHAGTLHW